MYYFTADSHFGHANILKYCKRPFKNVLEMDKVIIDNINKVVQPGDTLYHLGDFAFARGRYEISQIREYRNRINCKNIILILGNHDPHTSTDQPKPWLKDIFSGVYIRMKIRVPFRGETKKIILSHYGCSQSGKRVSQTYICKS